MVAEGQRGLSPFWIEAGRQLLLETAVQARLAEPLTALRTSSSRGRRPRLGRWGQPATAERTQRVDTTQSQSQTVAIDVARFRAAGHATLRPPAQADVTPRLRRRAPARSAPLRGSATARPCKPPPQLATAQELASSTEQLVHRFRVRG
jgi:hypothetical protein